ncbi:MAG: homoserine kinase [Chloroflexota bacterium]
MKRLSIDVPATSANLGPGFDTLAMALDLSDVFRVELADAEGDVVLSDPPAGIDPLDNLVCRAYRSYAPGLPAATFALEAKIPIGKGLGSSAGSILAGLAAAVVASGEKPDRARTLRQATDLEGHPDNVAAALLGGLTVAFREGENVHAAHVATHLAMDVVVFTPEQPLPTTEARAIMPAHVDVSDAVFDISRVAYLVTALIWGRWDRIGAAMEDRIHQPYRERLIPALGPMMKEARVVGAYGAALSGGGPSVLALAPFGSGETVAKAMEDVAQHHDWPGQARVLAVREDGMRVREEKPS